MLIATNSNSVNSDADSSDMNNMTDSNVASNTVADTSTADSDATASSDSNNTGSASTISDSGANNTSSVTSASSPSPNTTDSNTSQYGSVIGNLANGDSIKLMSQITGGGSAYNSITPYACYSTSDETGSPDKLLLTVDVSGYSKKDIVSKYMVDSAYMLSTLIKQLGSTNMQPNLYMILSVDGNIQDDYVEYTYNNDSDTYVEANTYKSGEYKAALTAVADQNLQIMSGMIVKYSSALLVTILLENGTINKG